MKSIVMVVTLLFVVSIAVRAKADVKSRHTEKNGYSYEFDDDPLNAGGFGANDALIKVRPRAARVTLIRPRVSFVKELLRSVESL